MSVQFEHPEQWSHLHSHSLELLNASTYELDSPQAHAIEFDDERQPQARCSLWWKNTPQYSGRRVGVIGHYAAASPECGIKLIIDSCKTLRDNECELAIGPMDGNTWRNYRFVTGGESVPRFLFEPNHPTQWPEHFTTAGFSVIARYYSAICENLSIRDTRADRVAARFANSGITIRCLNRRQIESDVKAIYDVTLAAFHDAFLFYAIDFEAYLKQVQPLVEQIDPRWVLLAEQDSEVIGFVFGAPDILQTHTKGTIDTAILKTLAVRPRRDLAGLGMLLLQRFHDTVREQGYRRVIHALMHLENGLSRSLSTRYSKPLRYYGLFAKELC